MTDAELLTPKLKQQAEQREQLVKERNAVRSAYRDIKDTPALQDLVKFIEAQYKGCKDVAATTENKFVADRAGHMMLMAGIIKEYIDNQTNI